MKIAIVEDDQNRLRQLRTILSSIGHRSADLEVASDYKTALSIIRKKRFDCAFFHFGRENAKIDTLKLLKDIRGGNTGKNLAVVMYSSTVTKENVMDSHTAGATTFLTHPFSVNDVEEILNKVNR